MKLPNLALSVALVGGALGIAMALPLPAAAQPAAAAAAVPPELPLRDFFRNPERSAFRISDDGRWLSFLQPAAGDGSAVLRKNVFVQRLQAGMPAGPARQVTRESARDITSAIWKGNSTLLYEKDTGGDENTHVMAVDAASGRIRDLTPYDGVRASVIDGLVDDREHILVSHNRRDPKVFDVLRLNVRSGAETLVATNPGNVTGWATDHRGRVRLATASDGVNSTLLHRTGDSGAFKPIISTDFRTSVSPLFFDFDNRRFYAVSNRGRDKAALVLIDPARPDAETVVYAHPQVDVYSAQFSRKRKVLTVAEFQVDRTERHFFDPLAARTQARLEARLPGLEVFVQDQTRDENQLIVGAASDRTQGARYVYDRRRDTLTKLGDIAPWLPEAAMATMTPVRYAARDGLEIPAYLTLPAGRPPKNLACIVNPHGGPWVRDAWGFNREVQFLANRGFCVLQMNYRGSTGYGRKFWEASFGQWGLQMQDDVTDGVRWLVAQGIADPKRVGIYGASYGGYATLAGVAFTPDLYAAAVDYVGVSSLFTFMESIPPYWEPWRQQMYLMVGNPETDKARLTATSPVFHVDRIRTPLLVAQGARDPRVKKSESDQLVQALRQRGVEVEYIVKDDEGHGFANEENKFEFYGAMERFFKRHLNTP